MDYRVMPFATWNITAGSIRPSISMERRTIVVVAELGTELAPGTFGENLTVGGLESMDYNIGDRFHIGTVVLEVTAPRILASRWQRMGDPTFVKRFRYAERPGLYCRVIQQAWSSLATG